MTTMTTSRSSKELIGSIGSFSPSKIQDKDMAKIMDMLSSNYSKPKHAVLRELITNAFDSHHAAGVDAPVQITLPTAERNTLVIKDTGLGLSPEGAVMTYDYFGHSDKEDDADKIGKYGIGSKSPHAVADQFTVEAIKDGTRSLFVFINTKNRRGSQCVDISETDQPNGVTITVPTLNDEWTDWLNAARDVLYYYETDSYRVTNYGHDEFENYRDHIDEHLSTDHVLWTVGRENGYQRNDASIVKLGPVGYDIPDSYYSRFEDRRWKVHNLIFSLGPKDIDLHHSRETIEHSRKNRDILTQHYNEWVETIHTRIIDHLGQVKTLEEYIEAFGSYYTFHSRVLRGKFTQRTAYDLMHPQLKAKFKDFEKTDAKDFDHNKASIMSVKEHLNRIEYSTLLAIRSNDIYSIAMGFHDVNTHDIIIEAQIVENEHSYYINSKKVNDKDRRVINEWRKLQNYPAVTIIQPGRDISAYLRDEKRHTFYTMHDIRTQLKSLRKTHRKKVSKTQQNADSILISLYSGRSDALQKSLTSIKEMLKQQPDTMVVVGTKDEHTEVFDQDFSTRLIEQNIVDDSLSYHGHHCARKLRYYTDNLMLVLRGNRSVQSMADVLGVSVMTPQEYLDHLVENSIASSSTQHIEGLRFIKEFKPEGKPIHQNMAYFLQRFSYYDLKNNHQELFAHDHEFAVALINATQMAWYYSVDELNLLIEHASLGTSQYTTHYPLATELISTAKTHPSPTLLNAVLEIDAANTTATSAA